MGPDRPYDSFGICFGPNGRFWTHFGPNLMFLDGTGTVVNEDWTWAEAWADLGLRPTLDDLGLRLGPILGRLWDPPDPPNWSAAVAASEGRGPTVIALVGRCRGLRRPVFGAMSKISQDQHV